MQFILYQKNHQLSRLKMSILLITSASFTAHSTGISQTLENIFDYFENDELILCTPTVAKGDFARYRTISLDIPKFLNRFPQRIKDIFFKNFQFPAIVKKLRKTRPDAVIIANLDKDQVVLCRNLVEGTDLPFFIYLLDNIEEHPDENVIWLMENATGHIFISKYMAESNIARFPMISKYAIAHNPVDKNEISSEVCINSSDKKSIAYAGALWPMHYDSYLAIAAAVKKLKESGTDIDFVTYTSPYFRDRCKDDFEKYKIVYGGFFPFSELKPMLKQHDALVVTSSFLEENRNLSAYSVQTKITDYLASGVPTLSIGPTFGACNRFIEEHQCGWCITEQDSGKVADSLTMFFEAGLTEKSEKAERGLNLMRTELSKKIIQKKINDFLISFTFQ